MTIKKNDFVEIEFNGKANGALFDTTSKEGAKEMGLETDVKPVVVSVGNGMVLKGFDDALIDKEIGKDYSIHLEFKDAFGPRNPAMIKTIPMRVFKAQNMNPMPGMTLQMDNQVAKVISVSGGRVMVDFNNPLAGKEIDYDFKILRMVEDAEDKINALQDFFFRQRFEFNIEGKKVVFKDAKIKPIVDMMKDKLKNISGFEFEVVEGEKKVEGSGKSEGVDGNGEEKKSEEKKVDDVDKK